VTRPVPKRTSRRFRPLFPDADEILRRAEYVAVQPVRHCYLCGSIESAKRRMVTVDEWQCEDDPGCGRRLLRRERA